MDHLVNEWFDRSTGVEELDRCSITLGHLYFGGMKKKDFLEILVEARKEGRDEDANTLLQVREQAGKALTQANIPTRVATQLLLNIGETRYQAGDREPYAIYAHERLIGRMIGCLKFVLGPIVFALVVYLVVFL